MPKKNVLKKSDIYAIVDRTTLGTKNISRFVCALMHNKIRILQLRDKKSSLQKLLGEALLIQKLLDEKTLFIVNDYPELCLLADADGLHLGQDDMPIRLARKIIGTNKVIGISCHSIRQALAAQQGGADYIGFGPVFSTPTKKEYKPIGTGDISTLKKIIKIPFFLIGGIDATRLEKMQAHKINQIAVCRPLCQSNNITTAARQLRRYLYHEHN